MKILLLTLSLFCGFASKAQTSTLVQDIASNADFAAIMSICDQAVAMPDPDNFLANFNESTLQAVGYEHLVDVTGFSHNSVTSLNDDLITHVSAVQGAFPDLSNLSSGELDHVIRDAANLYSDAYAARQTSCADCKKDVQLLQQALF